MCVTSFHRPFFFHWLFFRQPTLPQYYFCLPCPYISPPSSPISENAFVVSNFIIFLSLSMSSSSPLLFFHLPPVPSASSSPTSSSSFVVLCTPPSSSPLYFFVFHYLLHHCISLYASISFTTVFLCIPPSPSSLSTSVFLPLLPPSPPPSSPPVMYVTACVPLATRGNVVPFALSNCYLLVVVGVAMPPVPSLGPFTVVCPTVDRQRKLDSQNFLSANWRLL